MRKLLILLMIFISFSLMAQDDRTNSSSEYKKRVLETAEVDFLFSYYTQDGDNAAISGGIGTEKLTDYTPTIVVSIPLNDDDVLTIDAGVSAYSSASSSNLNPFDGKERASPFQASSGASGSDKLLRLNGSFSHSSDDRNKIWSVNAGVSKEYDYLSLGFGGSYTRLFNQKNTEISLRANVFLDKWSALYPIELLAFRNGGVTGDPKEDDSEDEDFFDLNNAIITGNQNYNPSFTKFGNEKRNSYSVGLGLSQIFSENLQGSLSLDFVRQSGLLSSPLQRVNFSDIEDSFVEDFQLADAIEILPDTRFKIAVGGRLNYYINERFIVRSYYRYYTDDWGIRSSTASIEIPIKLSDRFTIYPTYRYYTQSKADYFAPHENHLSTEQFFTSDFDLSGFNSNQYGFGIRYSRLYPKWGFKSIDLKFNQYQRSTGLNASIISIGIKFVLD